MKRGACWIDLDFLPQALTMLARAGLKCVAIISDPWDPRALVAIDGDLLPPECEGNRRFVLPKFVRETQPDNSFADRLDTIELLAESPREALRQILDRWPIAPPGSPIAHCGGP
jgi:hypothetical protein